MILHSVIVYISLAGLYFFCADKIKRTCMLIGVMLSSFMAYMYFLVDNTLTIIYLIVGIACIFFYWIYIDNEKTQKRKNKYFAALLALMLGWLGVHKFYLKKPVAGTFYLLFTWTMIPHAISIVEAVYLFFMSKSKFNVKYNDGKAEISIPATTKKISVNEKELQCKKQQENTEHEDRYEEKQEFFENDQALDDEDIVNYRTIRLSSCEGKAVGTIEDFKVSVFKNGKRFDFRVKDGDICSYKTPYMTTEKYYEVN